MNITYDRLKQVLYFDEELGRFFWNEKIRGIKIGDQAGSFDAHGYGQIRIDGKIYKEHHLVWFYKTGNWPKCQIDHCNHDRRDNRFSNLRECDNLGNHCNRPMQRNNTSGFVGVSFEKNRYAAYITLKGKKINLGRFESIDDAASARKVANELYGFHENHGIGKGISKKVPTLRKEKLKALKEGGE